MTPRAGHDDVRRELERLGFEPVAVRGAGWHLRRMRDRVHDHVSLVTTGSWLRRLVGAARAEVRVGVLVPQVEQTFVRPVPRAAAIPGQVHAVMPLGPHEVPTAAIVAGWCDRWNHPLQLLEEGVVDDPVVALELAVVARSHDHAARVAAAARSQLEGDDSAPGRLRSRRLETAAAQLGV